MVPFRALVATSTYKIKKPPKTQLTIRPVSSRLTQLTPAQYDRVRLTEADRIGIRLETLDSETARRRPDVSRYAKPAAQAPSH
jgi:mRNA-degrading endonuclease toxin of MazEF toxin-antitoxin module